MARGRFISNTLGRSKKYNMLPDHFAKLVYVHTLTMADEQGRIEADPISIYGDHFVVDPEANLERIEAALQACHAVGLIQLYEVSGKRYAQFCDFHRHNVIYRKKDGTPQREGASQIPAPQDDCTNTAQLLHSSSAVSYYKDKGKDKDEDEGEGEVANPATAPNHETSEERMQNRLAGGTSSNDTHRVRAAIRRIHPEFAKANEDSMNAWARWTNQDIQQMWEASHPNKWPDGNKKRRTWIFADLLNEERDPPPPPVEHVDWVTKIMTDAGLEEFLEDAQ